MALAIVPSSYRPGLAGSASDEVHALAEEIHHEEGLTPIDALCRALAISGEVTGYATRWDAQVAGVGAQSDAISALVAALRLYVQQDECVCHRGTTAGDGGMCMYCLGEAALSRAEEGALRYE